MKREIIRNITITIAMMVISMQMIHSQQNILYFMNGIHQSSELNPAYQSNCKVFVGMPVLSNISLNLSNTGFKYNDFIRKGTGSLSDSLIMDWNNVKGKLGKNNYFLANFNLTFLNFGFWADDNYFTFSMSNKTSSYFSYPKDLATLSEGNGNNIGEDNALKLNGVGPHAINYTELAFGMSRQIDKQLTVGGKMKILMGAFALSKKKTDLELYTADVEKNYELTLKTDMEINASGPITVKKGDNGKVDDLEVDDIKVSDVIFPAKNMGLAFDFGATYQLNDQVKLYASIIDLGFIRWSKNTYGFHQKEEVSFDGINIALVGEDSNGDIGKQVGDSIGDLFEFDESNGKFTTWLSTSIYLGGTYEVTEGINLGLLSKTFFYNRKLHQGVILSANFTPTNWFSGTLSYSMINRSYANLGMGMGLNLGGFQIYMLTDYITATKLKSSKSLGFQLGLNMYFGCKNRKNQLNVSNLDNTF